MGESIANRGPVKPQFVLGPGGQLAFRGVCLFRKRWLTVGLFLDYLLWRTVHFVPPVAACDEFFAASRWVLFSGSGGPGRIIGVGGGKLFILLGVFFEGR